MFNGTPKLSLNIYAQYLKPYGYEVKQILGSGAFAEVVLAIQNQEEFAIKCIKRRIIKEKPELLIYIKNEFKVMQALQHPNIVKQFGIIEDHEFYFIILQYCDMGNLLIYQSQLKTKRFTLTQTIEIIVKLLKGLKIIHDKGFIHRDLKHENILIKKDQGKLNFKIGDFGFARPIQNIVKTYCGTTNFMAPQILTDKPYNVSVDCWSLGVVMFFMLFGEFPFKGLDILSDIRKKCKTGYNLRKHILNLDLKSMQQEELLVNFFERLFLVDPSRRMGLKQIMEHKLFSCYFVQSNNFMISSPKKENILHNKLKRMNSSTDDYSSEEEQNNPFKDEKKYVTFEIEKMIFLRESMEKFCEKNQAQLKEWERFGLKYYLLKAYIFYFQQLLKNLTEYISPFQNPKGQWKSFCTSEYGVSLVKEFSETIVIAMSEFHDAYLMLKDLLFIIPIKHFQDSFSEIINQNSFEGFKNSYRSIISHIFKNIKENSLNHKEQITSSMKLRLFCCHLINRVFQSKNIHQNLFHYLEWKKKHHKSDSISFENQTFKQWLSSDTRDNLQSTISHLYKRYMAK